MIMRMRLLNPDKLICHFSQNEERILNMKIVHSLGNFGNKKILNFVEDFYGIYKQTRILFQFRIPFLVK
jgi:hypothetical protein